jgi:hypothetical protein
MPSIVVKQYVGGFNGQARRSIRRRPDGLFQIWDDDRYAGRGYDYADWPISGLFGDLAAAKAEFLRLYPEFEPEP